jgi:hypothetical protein
VFAGHAAQYVMPVAFWNVSAAHASQRWLPAAGLWSPRAQRRHTVSPPSSNAPTNSTGRSCADSSSPHASNAARISGSSFSRPASHAQCCFSKEPAGDVECARQALHAVSCRAMYVSDGHCTQSSIVVSRPMRWVLTNPAGHSAHGPPSGP